MISLEIRYSEEPAKRRTFLLLAGSILLAKTKAVFSHGWNTDETRKGRHRSMSAIAKHHPCLIRVPSVAHALPNSSKLPKSKAPLSGSRGWRAFFVFARKRTRVDFMIFRFRRYSNLDRRLRQIAEIIKSSGKIQRDIFKQFLLTTKPGNELPCSGYEERVSRG